MATERSSEEILDRYITDMGDGLGRAYKALEDDLTWLHFTWSQYRHLYAHSPERVDLLNRAAGPFFRMLQDTLADAVVLNLSRLVDPIRTGSKENLTVQMLPALCPPAMQGEVGTLVTTAVDCCNSAKVNRDKRIAHRDLGVAIKTGATVLPALSRAYIEKALEALRAVMHCVEGHYWDSQTAFGDLIVQGREADSLVEFVERAMAHEDKEMARLLARGTPR